MKITQEKTFQPVTIIIESDAELTVLRVLTQNSTFVTEKMNLIAREFHSKLSILS